MARVPFRLLFITDGWDARTTPARVDAALAASEPGAAAVHLRARGLAGRDLLDAARALVAVTHAHGALLLVNDRVDVALAAGADGAHLPSRGLTPSLARRLGERLVIGVSTHSLAEATRAQADGADYVVFGPIFFTPSKAELGQPVGLGALAAVTRAVAIPVFALGGVDASNAADCVARGAGLACIGAVLGRDDAASGARSLRDALKRSG